MARPVTRPVSLRNGYYIEIRQRGEGKGIKIRRETEQQMKAAFNWYKPFYDVKLIGKVENGQVVESKD